ncbi:MAG: hypothetical protein COB10_07145 [Planctomycetota bacterium]|jgi:uncharacterized alpha/beta hydrolase family protein|nr:MAG: hypothetical protein COB10_07145 [Planctomycetota bacterium]HIC23272.1 hypothetical protein [Planctomycetota bacterium]
MMIKNRTSRILIVLGGVVVIGILANIFSSGASGAGPLKVGDLVPDLTLTGSDGQEHSFRKIIAQGDGLVVAWIPKTGTPG